MSGGQNTGKIDSVDVYVTDMHYHPSSRQRKGVTGEYFCVGCTDGTYTRAHAHALSFGVRH